MAARPRALAGPAGSRPGEGCPLRLSERVREEAIGDTHTGSGARGHAVLDALDATPVVDRPPAPPGRTLALRW